MILREWGKIDIEKFNLSEKRFKINEYPNANLEIGSGNGLFLTRIALKRQGEFFFGIENKIKCINLSKRKIDNHGIRNIILIYGNIFTAVDRFFEPEFFDNIYINFPDPWFKRRHRKKRVIQNNMTLKYRRYLKNEGRLFFVTDNEEYRDNGILSLINNGFAPEFNPPYFVDNFDDYPVSLYEEKWKKEGRGIFYSVFKN